MGLPGVTAFRAGAGDRGRGKDIDHGALADVIAAEHDDVAWTVAVEDEASDAVSDHGIEQQGVSAEPVGCLAAA